MHHTTQHLWLTQYSQCKHGHAAYSEKNPRTRDLNLLTSQSCNDTMISQSNLRNILKEQVPVYISCQYNKCVKLCLHLLKYWVGATCEKCANQCDWHGYYTAHPWRGLLECATQTELRIAFCLFSVLQDNVSSSTFYTLFKMLCFSRRQSQG